ncbi:hypothetical protein SRHO_G00216550 [Serrasalmus rhombeus]
MHQFILIQVLEGSASWGRIQKGLVPKERPGCHKQQLYGDTKTLKIKTEESESRIVDKRICASSCGLLLRVQRELTVPRCTRVVLWAATLAGPDWPKHQWSPSLFPVVILMPNDKRVPESFELRGIRRAGRLH